MGRARSICTQRFASCHFSQHWNRYLLDCPICMTSCHSYARHTRRSKKFPRPPPKRGLATPDYLRRATSPKSRESPTLFCTWRATLSVSIQALSLHDAHDSIGRRSLSPICDDDRHRRSRCQLAKWKCQEPRGPRRRLDQTDAIETNGNGK